MFVAKAEILFSSLALKRQGASCRTLPIFLLIFPHVFDFSLVCSNTSTEEDKNEQRISLALRTVIGFNHTNCTLAKVFLQANTHESRQIYSLVEKRTTNFFTLGRSFAWLIIFLASVSALKRILQVVTMAFSLSAITLRRMEN